jgi:predicted CoA-binding protein
MILDTAGARRDLLARSKTIAVVGASANPNRPSYFVFSFLRTSGEFEVTPINPMLANGIDGVAAFPSLEAYAAERGAPDIVDVFRKPEEAPQVARDAVAAGAKAIWFQYGVVNAEAIRIADDAGLDVVVDRCIKVETARFGGTLALGGMNTGVISSRRRPAR